MVGMEQPDDETLVGQALARRIALERPEGMGIQIDEATAQAIASQVRSVLQGVPQPRGTVHLFMAAPLAVAVMIGWHLNMVTPVQCYELPPGAATYEPSCRL